MTDRVHPSSKPPFNTVNVTTINNPKLPLPPAKAYLYNQNMRYPINKHRNRGNRCFCLCYFWLILIIIFTIILTTISGTVLYLLYRPHRPEFSVSSLKIFKFNLTTAADGTTRLSANLNLTITTNNPNKKIEFRYDQFAIACVTDGVEIANGFFGNLFVSNPNNVTIIRSSLSGDSLLMETETVSRIRSDMKRNIRLKLKILLDTHAVMKVGSFKSKKVRIRIKCEGIRSVIPKASGAKSSSSSLSSVSASVSDAKCEADFRIKVWKWTF